MASATTSFEYASLKELLKDTTAEIVLPTDGDLYEKSIERWSEHCIKRAVSFLILCPNQSIELRYFEIFL